MSIKATYLNGDAITLPPSCHTVMDVRFEVAKLNDCTYVEIKVFGESEMKLLRDNEPAPKEVQVILAKEAGLAGIISQEDWVHVIFEYCQRKDPVGLETMIEVFLESEFGKNNKAVAFEILGKVFLQLADIETAICMKCAEILIKHNADINALSETSETPLILASYRGHEELVDLLLENEADIDETDDDEHTALYLALKEGNIEIIQKLLQHDAAVDAITDEGRSVLHEACALGNVELVRKLLELGAPYNLAGKSDKRTPLMVASHLGNMQVVKALLQFVVEGGSKKSPKSSSSGGSRRGSKLGAAGQKVGIDNVDVNGNTALILAARRGHDDCVGMLLNAGADFSIENTKAGEGKTALEFASDRAHAGCAVLLQFIEEEGELAYRMDYGSEYQFCYA